MILACMQALNSQILFMLNLQCRILQSPLISELIHCLCSEMCGISLNAWTLINITCSLSPSPLNHCMTLWIWPHLKYNPTLTAERRSSLAPCTILYYIWHIHPFYKSTTLSMVLKRHLLICSLLVEILRRALADWVRLRYPGSCENSKIV